MLPNIHIYERLILQQIQERQREIARQRLCRRPHRRIIRLAMGRLEILFVALGTRMKQLEAIAPR